MIRSTSPLTTTSRLGSGARSRRKTPSCAASSAYGAGAGRKPSSIPTRSPWSTTSMSKTIYLIQHITGYGPADKYEEKATKLRDAGFVCCRSEKGGDGKYWEVWLGYGFKINATLCGDTTEKVTSWLVHN